MALDPVWGRFDMSTAEGWTDFQVASAWGIDWRTNPDPNIRISGGGNMYAYLYGGNVSFFAAHDAEVAAASTPEALAAVAARRAARKAAKQPTGGAMPDITLTNGSTYTTQQIVDWVNARVAAGDGQGIYTAAQAGGISMADLDRIMGWAPNTAENWVTANVPAAVSTAAPDSVITGAPSPAAMYAQTFTPAPQAVVSVAHVLPTQGAGVSGLGRGGGRVGHRAAARVQATQAAPLVPSTNVTAPTIAPAAAVSPFMRPPFHGAPPLWMCLAAVAAFVVIHKH